MTSLFTRIGNIEHMFNTSSLTSGTDLNTLTASYAYRVGNMNGMTNKPTGAGTTGVLYIMNHTPYILQAFWGNEALKYRFSFDNATSWTSWV